MKHPSFSILKYLVEESYICEILINKMTNYFELLPRELELKKLHSSAFPTEEQRELMMSLDLLEQLKLYGKNIEQAHTELVRFYAFIDMCANSIQHQTQLVHNLCTSLFNSFLLWVVQPRIVESKSEAELRTTFQYIAQMLEVFSNSFLIKVIYIFLFGFHIEIHTIERVQSDL
jgi:Retinoic acid induced 16-like protein